MSSHQPELGKTVGTLLQNPEKKIYIAGHRGLVGSAIWRNLAAKGHTNVMGWSSVESDLRDSKLTMKAIKQEKPDVIIMAAAKVGGIVANSILL
jgi:GDP-L-fucose synthase